MNLKKYKLIHEDEKTFRFRHEDGHELPVAKSHLGSEYIDQVRQQFSYGGPVRELADMAEGATPDPIFNVPNDPEAQAGLAADPSIPLSSLPSQVAFGLHSPQPQTEVASIPPPSMAPPVQRPAFDQPPFPDPNGMTLPPPTARPQAPSVGYGAAFPKGAEKEIADSYKAQQTAEMHKADVAAKAAEAESRQITKSQAIQAAFERQAATEVAANQAEGDKVREGIANSKIDPGQFWGSRSTGQKISASIGMILGGIGSAIAGGPNHAVQIIDNAISRDIDAQKAELGKKENLLSSLMQKGHSLQQAQQLARAQLYDVAAGNLKKVSLSTAGEAQMAVSESVGAQLAGAAAQSRVNAAKEKIQFQSANLELAQRKQQMDASAAALAAQKAGIPTTKEDRERAVQYGGGYRMAASPTDAQAVRDTLAEAENLKNLAKDMRKFRTEKGAQWTASADSKTGHALMARAVTSLNKIAKLGALSESDQKLLAAQVPDIQGTWLSGTTDPKVFAMLDALDNQIQDSVSSALNNKTDGPKIPARINASKAGGLK